MWFNCLLKRMKLRPDCILFLKKCARWCVGASSEGFYQGRNESLQTTTEVPFSIACLGEETNATYKDASLSAPLDAFLFVGLGMEAADSQSGPHTSPRCTHSEPIPTCLLHAPTLPPLLRLYSLPYLFYSPCTDLAIGPWILSVDFLGCWFDKNLNLKLSNIFHN